jgi:hypothetical protein
MSETTRKAIAELYDKILKDILTQRESPRDFFDHIYPDGVPPEKMEAAIDLCDQTIKTNKAGRMGRKTR